MLENEGRPERRRVSHRLPAGGRSLGKRPHPRTPAFSPPESAPLAQVAPAAQFPANDKPRLYNGLDGSKTVEFCIFDAPYVQRLAAGDPVTEAHFSAYFARFLTLKLRARRLSPQMAEDVRQETMFRVLKSLRQGAGVAQPERFGAFVNAVCNNIVLEFLHKEGKHIPAPENTPEQADDSVTADVSLITEERKQIVAQVLDGLAAKDREILRLVFFEEVGRDEVCKKLGVESDYLRVLLHRAKGRFEQAWLRKRGVMGSLGALFC
jgi:RNA polymerase sigma-70 factor, ECF subfamily